MSPKDQFIEAISIYVDPNVNNNFSWTCTKGALRGQKFLINATRLSWKGEIRTIEKGKVKWRRLQWSYYGNPNSIKKAIKFYKKFK